MALFTKILILALCAITAVCASPLPNEGRGGMRIGHMMGMEHEYPFMDWMMHPGMMYPGMMYPGMMRFKNWHEIKDNLGSPTLHPLPNSSSMPPESDNSEPRETPKAIEDVADQIQQDHPETTQHEPEAQDD